MALYARISTPPRINAAVQKSQIAIARLEADAALRASFSSTNVLRVQTSGDALVNVALRKILIANAKLEELENVDAVTYGLNDGFTVVYNALTQTWQTQHITTVINQNLEIDGGTY